MSEEIPAILSESPETPIVRADFGASLRAARERLGLDVEEAARQLRLSPRQVAALEADDVAALPSPTFVRGFIRNYARLLQLDPEPLLARYREMSPENPSGASISLHSEGIPIQAGNRKAWVPYVAASVLLGVALGGWWAFMDWHEHAPEQSEVATKPAQVAVPAPVAEHPPAESVPVGNVALPAEPSPPPAPLVVPPAATPPASTAASQSSARIQMKFIQPSWVRVTDRDGKEIYHKNASANTEDTIDGVPPFKVDIGNTTGVQLSYNGQPVDLAPHAKANVAHLTLE